MSTRGGGGDASGPATGVGRGRAFDLRTVVAVAAVGLALYWAVREIRDAMVPAKAWTRQLRDGDADRRVEAARGLGSDEVGPDLRPTAAEALAAALADPYPEVAANAAQSLAALIRAEPDAESARSWSEALAAGLRDPRPDVRGATASALTYAASSPAAQDSRFVSDALASLLDDPDEGLRRIGIAALADWRAGEAGLRALVKVLDDDPMATTRAAAARALSGYPGHEDEATRALLRGLRSGGDAGVRHACVDALGAHRRGTDGPRWSTALVPDLVAALSDPDRTTRERAAMMLGETGPGAVAAVPALAAMLGETDDGPGEFVPGPFVAPPPALAAEALGKIAPGTTGEDEAAEALAAVLQDPRRSGPGDAAALALARFPDPRADLVVPRLVAILDAWADGAGGEPTTLDEMRAREILGENAIGAVEALGRLGPIAKPALPRLREMEKLEGSRFRRIAEEAARRIEGAAPAAPSGGRE
ncbi:HEAT repeat domain-containing protein [Paludisphaera sp.]|uniref:HEAT repeat domain-containing protein n=1 Tax=Paludisphaera sp. TaxID=2017432 RepID=UPI00301B82F0